MTLLSVQGLCKQYHGFRLDNVSFELPAGYIMGFIGRNGAGKTTTLKAMLNLIKPDAGTVTMMGKDFYSNELFCKQNIGCVFGGFDFYPKRSMADLTSIIKDFYQNWDDAAYQRYMQQFNLDERKGIYQLSAGMKVKYALALALSHNAQLLLLDEPTSGLDPVSRDELLEIFQGIIEDGQHSILFSTHITSDLEKCADYITYIRDGRIAASEEKDSFRQRFLQVSGKQSDLTPELMQLMIGYRENAFGFTGLIKADDKPKTAGLDIAAADLETIMIYHERELVEEDEPHGRFA